MYIYCQKGIEYPTNLKFLDKKRYVQRAGIVPFMVDKTGETFILLGVDKDTNVFADLGGTTEKGETVLDTAIREYLEESRSIISVDLNRTSKIFITYVYGKKKQAIMFVQVNPIQYNIDIDDYFQATIPRNKYEDEMSKLKWIRYKDFLNLPDSMLSKSMIMVRKLMLDV